MQHFSTVCILAFKMKHEDIIKDKVYNVILVQVHSLNLVVGLITLTF